MDLTQIACVGAVVRDSRGRILMVRRANEPGRGQWSIPGGRIEAGETHQEALVREVLEETGLRVIPSGLAGVVERSTREGTDYLITDYFARLEPGESPGDVVAGDDASEAGWFTGFEIEQMDCIEGLVEALRDWRVVPVQRRP